MVEPTGSIPFADLLEGGVNLSPDQAAPSTTETFDTKLLSLLKEAASSLGVNPESIRVVASSGQTEASAQNSSSRQFLVTIGSPVQTPTDSAPYVPFDLTIPAWDITRINTQQAARNDAFHSWVSSVSARLEQMGYKPEVTFEQSPGELFAQPLMARIRLPQLDPDCEGALTLYHYDAWRDQDAASLLLSQLTLAKDA